MNKIDYITKDFAKEFCYLYDAKKKYFGKKLVGVAKENRKLSIGISECARLGLTPVYVFPNVSDTFLGIVWQFPYLLKIEGNGGYREFTIRYENDIDVAVAYYLNTPFPEGKDWEDFLYVVDGEVYDKDRFGEYAKSFKGYLTNFYAMDTVYGDIARRLVNDKKFPYEDSNDWEKVVAFLKKIYGKDEREKMVAMTKQMWDMYK